MSEHTQCKSNFTPMTNKQILNSLKLKIKHYDISYADIARNMPVKPVSRAYIHAVINYTGKSATQKTLLAINQAMDSIILEREALSNSIKISN